MKKTFSRTKTFINLSLITLSIVGLNQQSFAQTEEIKEKEEKAPIAPEKSGQVIGVAKIDATDKSTAAIKYRRSSLHTMIIEDAKLPKIDIILKTFNEAPFPDKYNNHTVGEKSFNLAKYQATVNDTAGGNEKKDNDLSPAINKYFADNKTANKIIAKWFSRKDNGAFDMSLIEERGLYDASAQDISIASSTARGDAMLADAGEELLPNTFVVVNYSKFISNEVAALAIKDAAYQAAADKGAFKETIEKVADMVYEKTRKGYSVWTTAYLYQINWNDSTSAVFYQNYWMDDSKIDPAKKEAFDKSDLFKLELLGFQKASTLISGLGSNAKDETMIIQNATLKSIDAVYAKLQRKFEKFRTKTPLTSVDPVLAAKIGLKEGVENGDKYEVLEQTIDELGKIKYKRKGVITVEKNKIWNNKFAPGEEPLDEEGKPIKSDYNLDYTSFKGGKGYYPGMLIRQIN